MTMNEKTVREIIARYLHTHQPRETALLAAEKVESVLKDMADRLHNKAGFGVTITQDHNGAWGLMGQRLVTLRWHEANGQDFVEISMAVTSISSQNEDDAHMQALQEDK